jgi:hypothetical protein
MFQGEKTNLFWVGLLLFGVSLLGFFAAVWSVVTSYLAYLSSNPSYYGSSYPFTIWMGLVPIVVGGVIFMAIGLYMMKSGVKKTQSPP